MEEDVVDENDVASHLEQDHEADVKAFKQNLKAMFEQDGDAVANDPTASVDAAVAAVALRSDDDGELENDSLDQQATVADVIDGKNEEFEHKSVDKDKAEVEHKSVDEGKAEAIPQKQPKLPALVRNILELWRGHIKQSTEAVHDAQRVISLLANGNLSYISFKEDNGVRRLAFVQWDVAIDPEAALHDDPSQLEGMVFRVQRDGKVVWAIPGFTLLTSFPSLQVLHANTGTKPLNASSSCRIRIDEKVLRFRNVHDGLATLLDHQEQAIGAYRSKCVLQQT